jgi:hypothetical protein
MTPIRHSRPFRSLRVPLLAAMIALAAPLAEAGAQDPRLDERFAPETRAALQALIDSARASGLPTEPLVQRALEGASRRVPPPRVLAAVRSLAGRLEGAREVLGPRATEAEIVAGASALYVGIEPAAIERIRRGRSGAGVALPLIVLVDIVERGVPRDTATTVIVSLSDPRVPDTDYQALRQSILSDIGSGAPPGSSAAARGRGVLLGRGLAPPTTP